MSLSSSAVVWGELPVYATRSESVAAAVEAGRRAGYDDGYRAGVEAGLAETARTRNGLTAEARALMASLADAAAALRARHVQSAAEVEAQIVQAALTLAEAVIGRELAVAASPGADALARAMKAAGPERPVVVRLNPDDLGLLDEVPDGVKVLADATIPSGGAVAEAGDWRVDAQVGPALERAKAVLR
jgi:flagellar assembly protein FliH